MIKPLTNPIHYRSLMNALGPRLWVSTSRMDIFPIESYDKGERLDRYLKKSPVGWVAGQKHLRKKDILVLRPTGEMLNESSYRFQDGDRLMISPFLRDVFAKAPAADDQRTVPFEEARGILDKMTLLDNQHLTIVNKPQGFVVQGGLNPHRNLFSLMRARYPRDMIHITHRLDKPTSGLVIFAKNKEMAQIIQMAMEERVCFGKFYLAVTTGARLDKSGYLRSNLEWTGKNKARVCSESEEGTKDCITYYQPVSSEKLGDQLAGKVNGRGKQIFKNTIGLKLLTGRKHQLRCHLSSLLEQPILNDTKYGGAKADASEEQEQIYLHSFGLLIAKKELADKIVGSLSRCYFNQKLGSLKHGPQGVLVTGVLPSVWPNQQIELEPLAESIEAAEVSMRSTRPSQRRILTLS